MWKVMTRSANRVYRLAVARWHSLVYDDKKDVCTVLCSTCIARSVATITITCPDKIIFAYCDFGFLRSKAKRGIANQG